jgi:hypothetical protein
LPKIAGVDSFPGVHQESPESSDSYSKSWNIQSMIGTAQWNSLKGLSQIKGEVNPRRTAEENRGGWFSPVVN